MSSRDAGSILDGKYEIVQPLGSGGMGEVHLVRHVHLQELRVVKILRQHLASDPVSQKRFLREARLATQIKHPNVAILYDFSRLEDGSFYMVWEHIEGEEVGERLRREGAFPVPQAVQLGIQALQGLEAIHGAGIIHRDIAPDNLMISTDKSGAPRIKIIDLGLARTLEEDSNFEITQAGTFMGKLQYCSPEQAGASQGASVDARSDLYSFALVLYEMLCGRQPFEADNIHGLVFKRLSESPLPLAARSPEARVPPELDQVVARALEREPDRRFPDARSFIQALEGLTRGFDAAATREIPLARVADGTRELSAVVPPTSRPHPPRELSRAERLDLLAQIDRAAERVRARPATPAAGTPATAAAPPVAATTPAPTPVETPPATPPAVSAAPAEAAGDPIAKRIAETEQVLTGYLQRKQLTLARLALETLLELSPFHPRRSDLESWVGLLAEEIEQDKRVETALQAGREAVARRDFKAARKELEVAARNDASGERTEAFARELEEAERGVQQSAEVERHRRSFEEHLAGRRIAEAESELSRLTTLQVSRVTLDAWRERLEEARAGVDRDLRAANFEKHYRAAVARQDWLAAREVAGELGQAVPSSPRPAQMFAEVDRLEADDRRRQAVVQGVHQVEAFLQQKDAASAELALKILLQMDPENRHRKRLEKQVRDLRG